MIDHFARIAEIAARRAPFAIATVVRGEPPTSAKPGARAIVAAAGRLEGWIGGYCATPVVIREAQQALADAGPRLIPLAGGPAGSRDGVRHFSMICHSGGTLAILIERCSRASCSSSPAGHPSRERSPRTAPRSAPMSFSSHPIPTPRTSWARSSARISRRSPWASLQSSSRRGEYDQDAASEALATPALYIAPVASGARAVALVEALA